MAKFNFTFTVSGEIEASTLEEARERLDYSIDFNVLRNRGVSIERTWEEVSKSYNGETAPLSP